MKKNRNSKSFSIWLVPDNYCFDITSSYIKLLSEKYEGPLITPHVTLVSGFLGDKIELIKKIDEISNMLKPFDIFFKSIGHKDEFFRSLYLIVSEDKNFKKSRNIALKELGIGRENDFIPHLSLVYGNFEEKKKKSMINLISKIPKMFKAEQIYLAYNDEINLKWSVVEKFNLNTNI